VPNLKCRRCGELTNTAISDHIDSPDDQADRCFAFWNKGDKKWQQGCGYSDEDIIAIASRSYADRIIRECP
jgi:hypothetical protein